MPFKFKENSAFYYRCASTKISSKILSFTLKKDDTYVIYYKNPTERPITFFICDSKYYYVVNN